MTYTTINLEAFSIVGIAVSTTNQNGQSQKDIGELWQRFYRDNVIDQIPDKASDDVYCVYTDYESDANGTYTTILGCKVTSLQNIPPNLTGKTIPNANFRLYKSTGKLPDSVLATWQHIWQTPIERRYQADFDLYKQNAQDSDNTEVETYVSIR